MISMPVGFYPFWFWNDTLSAGEIRRQIHEMADKGVRGFFIHSRQGLGQPYLSEAFFEMVDVAVAAARDAGLVVHLYDEYPYPSGVAGGEVVMGNPHFHATQLVPRTYDLDGGPVRLTLPRGKVLACVAYPLVEGAPAWDRGLDLRAHVGPVLTQESYNEMGLTQYNRKRYFASDPAPVLEATLPAGPHRLYVAVQAEVTHHKYWHHFVDVLNPEAVRTFLALTHDRYAARYGDAFGDTILSIFVDETAPGWSACLPAAFEAETGTDLLAHLPALMDPAHPDHTRVAHDLGRVRYRQFCESFEAQVAARCRAHGLAYAGEKPSVRMAQLRFMDIPGCEPGHTKVGAQPDWLQARLRSNAKATASAAYFYGKPGALCECYHSTGWSATLQDAKTVADGLLLAGIRYLVPHGFFYSTHALKKHDAPPTFFFQMPFWPHFGALSDHVDRVARAFEGTHIDADLLVVDPGSGLPLHEDRAAYPYLAAYEALLWALMRAHLDVHIVDTDILAEGALGQGQVTVRDVVARVVVLPAMLVVEPPLQAWLDRFEAGGGVVIRCDVASPADTVVAQVLPHVQPSLSATVGGKEAGDLLLVKRVGPKRTLWFGLNVGREPLDVTFRPAASDPGAPVSQEAEALVSQRAESLVSQRDESLVSQRDSLRELPLDPALPPALRVRDGATVRRVAPFESFLVEAVPAATVEPPLPAITVPVTGPAEVRPLNANLLRLGTWQMALRQQDGRWSEGAAVPAVPLANQLALSGLPFAPDFQIGFGHAPELRLPSLTVRYRAAFECAYAGPVELVMEPGSIVGDASVTLNAAPPLTEADWTPTGTHVRGSLGIDVTDRIVPGANTIEVIVTTDRLDGGLRNPLYLAGAFGVTLDPLGLVPLPATGRFEDYEGNRLPFYAGVIETTTRFDLPAVPAGDRVVVTFAYDSPCHEATEVAINDGAFQPVLWEPRQVVVPAHTLHPGTNTLRTRVYTTLIRAFEGQWFDVAAHRYREVGSPDPNGP